MKITKRQLRRIIREEKKKILEQHDPLDPFNKFAWREDAVVTAWDAIEVALDQAMDAGVLELAAFQQLEGQIKAALDPDDEMRGDWS